jgi:hypothetical protein
VALTIAFCLWCTSESTLVLLFLPWIPLKTIPTRRDDRLLALVRVVTHTRPTEMGTAAVALLERQQRQRQRHPHATSLLPHLSRVGRSRAPRRRWRWRHAVSLGRAARAVVAVVAAAATAVATTMMLSNPASAGAAGRRVYCRILRLQRLPVRSSSFDRRLTVGISPSIRGRIERNAAAKETRTTPIVRWQVEGRRARRSLAESLSSLSLSLFFLDLARAPGLPLERTVIFSEGTLECVGARPPRHSEQKRTVSRRCRAVQHSLRRQVAALHSTRYGTPGRFHLRGYDRRCSWQKSLVQL